MSRSPHFPSAGCLSVGHLTLKTCLQFYRTIFNVNCTYFGNPCVSIVVGALKQTNQKNLVLIKSTSQIVT